MFDYLRDFFPSLFFLISVQRELEKNINKNKGKGKTTKKPAEKPDENSREYTLTQMMGKMEDNNTNSRPNPVSWINWGGPDS